VIQSGASIPDIITNHSGRYDGNLVPYYKAVFFQAHNVRHPYHNFRHMLHVTWLCYQAALYYSLCGRKLRNLLIAALFHDFDHSGQFGNDDLNIERAVQALRHHVQPEDEQSLADIEALIRTTEYPHTIPGDQLDLSAKILRDADMSQSFSIAWIQQIVFGLAAEWNKSPLEVLKAQRGFHAGLTFQTQWAREYFPPEVIDAKILEAQAHLAILET